MRHVVVQNPLDDTEVHPPEFRDQWAEVCLEASNELLHEQLDPVKGGEIVCHDGFKPAFSKHAYDYMQCTTCGTLFVSPRPLPESVEWYWRRSPAAELRRSEVYLAAMDSRMRQVSGERADWVADLCATHAAALKGPIADLRTRTEHYFAACHGQGLGRTITIRPPSGRIAEAADEAVVHLSDLNGRGLRLLTAFDVLENLPTPKTFFSQAAAALAPGGLLAITTRAGSGFDILVLWERSVVFPLEHLNLYSVEGLRFLLEEAGFEILELSTPGRLDVQLIERVAGQESGMCLPRFMRYILEERHELTHQHLQAFLQENLLSSHVRVVARRL